MKPNITLPSIFFLISLFISVHLPAQPQRGYQARYATLAHRLLAIEKSAFNADTLTESGYFDDKFRLLDNLADSVKRNITPMVPATGQISRPKAIQILTALDKLLLSNNFVVSIPVETLAEALDPKTPQQLSRLPYRAAKNFRRTDQLYTVDCDLGSILLISFGEILGIPLNLVEVPSHNFFRCRLGDGTYLNWDFNSATVYSDDDFRAGKSPTARQSFSRNEEVAAGYLRDLSSTEVISYYEATVGNRFKTEKNYNQAEKMFQRAIKTNPDNQLALNNLSWLYLTVSVFKDDMHYQAAYQLSSKVDGLNPYTIEYKDTYSCAFAAVGMFEQAVKTEKLARNKAKRLAAYLQQKTCLDIGEQ